MAQVAYTKIDRVNSKQLACCDGTIGTVVYDDNFVQVIELAYRLKNTDVSNNIDITKPSFIDNGNEFIKADGYSYEVRDVTGAAVYTAGHFVFNKQATYSYLDIFYDFNELSLTVDDPGTSGNYTKRRYSFSNQCIIKLKLLTNSLVGQWKTTLQSTVIYYPVLKAYADIKDIKYGSYSGNITMRPLIVRRPDPLYNNYYSFFWIDTYDMQYQITENNKTFVNTVNSFYQEDNITYNNAKLQSTNYINLLSLDMYTPNDDSFFRPLECYGYFYIEFIESETIEKISSTNYRSTYVANSYEIHGSILNHKKYTIVREGPKNELEDDSYFWHEISRTETINAFVPISENWVLRLNVDKIREYQKGQFDKGATKTDLTDYVFSNMHLGTFIEYAYSGSKHIKALYKGSDLLYEYNG